MNQQNYKLFSNISVKCCALSNNPETYGLLIYFFPGGKRALTKPDTKF